MSDIDNDFDNPLTFDPMDSTIDHAAINERLNQVLDLIPAEIREEVVGRDESTIKRYRKKSDTIQLHSLIRVASKTGVSLDWLVWGDGHKLLSERRALPNTPAQNVSPYIEDNYLYYDERMLSDMVVATEEMARREKWRPLSPEDKAKIVVNIYRHACRERARERGIDSHRLRMEADKALRTIYDILRQSK